MENPRSSMKRERTENVSSPPVSQFDFDLVQLDSAGNWVPMPKFVSPDTKKHFVLIKEGKFGLRLWNKSSQRVGASFSVCGKSLGALIHVSPQQRIVRNYCRISNTEIENLSFTHRNEDCVVEEDSVITLDNIEKVEVSIHSFLGVKVVDSSKSEKKLTPPKPHFSQEVQHFSKKVKSMGDIVQISGSVESKQKVSKSSGLKSIFDLQPIATFQLYCKWRPNLQIMQLPGIPPTKFSDWNAWATNKISSLQSNGPTILRPYFDIPSNAKVAEEYKFQPPQPNTSVSEILEKLQLQHLYFGDLIKALSFALFGNGDHANLIEKIVGSEKKSYKRILALRRYLEIDIVIIPLNGLDNPIHIASHFPYPEKKCIVLTYLEHKYGSVSKVATEDLPPLIDIEAPVPVIELD